MNLDDPNVIELKRLEKQHNVELETFRRSAATWQMADSLAKTLERQRDKDEKDVHETYGKVQFLRRMLDSEKQARTN
jgi:hypothetical protein